MRPTLPVCSNGHVMTEENTYRRPDGGNYTECKTCRRNAYLRWKDKNGEAAAKARSLKRKKAAMKGWL